MGRDLLYSGLRSLAQCPTLTAPPISRCLIGYCFPNDTEDGWFSIFSRVITRENRKGRMSDCHEIRLMCPRRTKRELTIKEAPIDFAGCAQVGGKHFSAVSLTLNTTPRILSEGLTGFIQETWYHLWFTDLGDLLFIIFWSTSEL